MTTLAAYLVTVSANGIGYRNSSRQCVLLGMVDMFVLAGSICMSSIARVSPSMLCKAEVGEWSKAYDAVVAAAKRGLLQ